MTIPVHTTRKFVMIRALCGILPWIAVLMPVWAGAAAQPGGADVGISPSPDNLVLSLSYEHEMLAESDPTPLLRIYGDGTVLIHRPEYMQRAGDYELQLNPGELRQLLRSWADEGVLDFDRQAVRDARRQEVQRRAGRGQLFHISDETHMELDIRLDWYRPAGGAQLNDFRKSIRWSNVAQEAAAFPGLPALRKLADAEEQLRSILDREDLRKVN